MRATPTDLPEVLLLEPTVFEDARGIFLESYNRERFNAAAGRQVDFVQDNYSRSVRGVLRGLHFQVAPHQQGKLVWVTRGTVFDVAVDVRPASATFARWVGVELSESNHRQLWIPPGFAHGFLVLSEVAEFQYKTTAYYRPDAERCICWRDPRLSIDWPLHGIEPVLSSKDAAAPSLDACVMK